MTTPGPWKAIGNKVTAIDHDHRFIIASCATRGRFKHTQEGEENNARLIAAAPELLTALESLFENCAMVHKKWGEDSNQKQADEAIKAGLAAIKKAKGL